MIGAVIVLVLIGPLAENGLDDRPPVGMLIGMLTCGGAVVSGLVSLVGLGLGAAGVCRGNRKRTFAYLEMILNGLILLGTGALFLIGLVVSGALR
jgi:hypothetical protein